MRALSAIPGSFSDVGRVEVGQVEVDMVLVLADAAAFADFDGHRARDHVARGQVLRIRRVALHEALAAAVAQDAAFAAHALGDTATGAVDARGAELPAPPVLQAHPGAHRPSPPPP